MNLNEEEMKILQEELYQEKFRQIIVENGIADDYVFLFEDCFTWNSVCICGTINIFKYGINEWKVFEIDSCDSKRFESAVFKSQLEAYKNAASRRGLDLNIQDIVFKDTDVIMLINSAKEYLMDAINFYGEDNTQELKERYSFLDKVGKSLAMRGKYIRLNNGEILYNRYIDESYNLESENISSNIINILKVGDLVKIEYCPVTSSKRIISFFEVTSIVDDEGIINLSSSNMNLQICNGVFKYRYGIYEEVKPVILSVITHEKLESVEFNIYNESKNRMTR